MQLLYQCFFVRFHYNRYNQNMYALLAFLGLIAALIAASRLASGWLLVLCGLRLYTVVFWPGVIIHELAHAAGAALTLTPIRGFSVIPKISGNNLVFGSVWHDETKNPLKLIVISLAPLVAGILLIRFWGAALPPLAAFKNLSTLTAREMLALYGIIAVAVHIAPSNQDLKHTARGAGLIGAIGIAAYLIGPWFKTDFVNPLLQFAEPFLMKTAPILSQSLLAVALLATITGCLVLAKRSIRS